MTLSHLFKRAPLALVCATSVLLAGKALAEKHDHEHHDHDHKHEHHEHDHKHDHDHDHDHDHKGHDHSLDAHEHGKAHLSLVWEHESVKIELDTPAMNIFGFEGKPADAAQEKTAKQQKAALAKLDNILEIEGVSCKVKSHKVEEEQHGHHSDLLVNTELTCDDVDDKEVEVHVELLENFPATETVVVEWIREGKAGQSVLTAEHHHFDLPAVK